MKNKISHIADTDTNYFTTLEAILEAINLNAEQRYIKKSIENTISKGYILIKMPESQH